MSLTEAQAMRMARHMQERGDEITAAINQCQLKDHGVVALKFSDNCKTMEIETLDEPFEPNVRVYRE